MLLTIKVKGFLNPRAVQCPPGALNSFSEIVGCSAEQVQEGVFRLEFGSEFGVGAVECDLRVGSVGCERGFWHGKLSIVIL